MDKNSPKIIRDVIKNLSKLPGIGKKSAFRLTFHLINSKEEYVNELINSIDRLKKNIRFCKKCYNFSEQDLCEICTDKRRDDSIICVVETVVDLYAIEESKIFNGLYHVLHGAISPIDGIMPEQIKIKELIKRILINDNIREVIIATNPTSEGNATAAFIIQQIEKHIKRKIKLSRIATGVPVGTELEFIDKITLSKALENRKLI